MKFPYMPISSIIADVRAEMKTMNQEGAILDDDCLNWAIECMREIGGANYDTKPAAIRIKNHVGTMPRDFYLVDKIYICSHDVQPAMKIGTIWFTEEGVNYYPYRLLYPGDAMTGTKYCTSSCVATTRDEPTYIIRNGQIRSGIADGVFGLVYVCLPQDEHGNYLIQDEIHTLKATKAFIKTKLLEDAYYSQTLSPTIYRDIKNEYDVHVDQAQAIFKFPDPADDKARGAKQDKRYDDFKLR